MAIVLIAWLVAISAGSCLYALIGQGYVWINWLTGIITLIAACLISHFGGKNGN